MDSKKDKEKEHNKYWRDREDEALKHYITDEKKYSAYLDKIYANMLDEISGEIERFYGKYATAEGISIAEAKKRVSQADIKAYERKAKQYVDAAQADMKKHGKDYKKQPSASYYFSKEANEEMRLYNTMMKINRLEMLKANIGLETVKGHAELETFMEGILQGRTEEELRRQAGILGDTIRDNAKAAHAIVNGSWQNGTFSSRIWKYQDQMRVDLGRLLQTGLIQGKNPRALVKDLRQYWYGADPKTGGGARYCMERLMRTELARVQTEAQKLSFERMDFDEYTFHANSGCCDDCQKLDGKHFKVKDMMPGENAAPMHPHCRCSCSCYEDSDEYEAWIDHLSKGGTTEEWNATAKAAWKKGEPVTPKAQQTQKFKKAETLKEATQRMSDALGTGNISLGRMPLELANEYLEGVERFMGDFPMLKGYYSQVGTKTGAAGIMGVNKLIATYSDDRSKMNLACGLHLKSTKELDKLLANYAAHAKGGGSYANESPLSTAIHELVHGLDHAITFKRYGGFSENGLGSIAAKDWNNAKAGVSQRIIKQVRDEMFGAQYGKEVAEKTRYLGRYARTSSKEELAEAISYEYVSESNPYSARILELFKEEVAKEFKE